MFWDANEKKHFVNSYEEVIVASISRRHDRRMLSGEARKAKMYWLVNGFHSSDLGLLDFI